MKTRHATRATLLSTVLVAFSMTAHAQIDPEEIKSRYQGNKMLPGDVMTTLPTTLNPWTSFRPEGTFVDWNYWEMRRTQAGLEKARFNREPEARVRSIRGTDVTAVWRFGTGRFQANTVQIEGEFELPPAMPLTPDPEDEGSIPLATNTGLLPGQGVVINGTIGDGAFGLAGTGSGDFDFYAIRGVAAGSNIVVDVDTALPFDPLDPAVAIYNASGELLAFNDDSGGTFDSFVSFVVPADGDYFVSIGTFGNPILNDPFDSSTGNGVETFFFPGGNEGEYTVTIGLDYFDERVFFFLPRRGDVIGAAVNGSRAQLELIDRTKTVRQGSQQNGNGFFNTGTPLPAGLASVGHIVDEFGPYRLRVRGQASGPFTIDLAAFLPELRTGERGDVQTIFIDFDGADVDLSESIFDGFPFPVPVSLSPLVDFLPNWGLTAADEDQVIDAILERVEETLVRDIARLGPNRRFDIKLLNSRDHADPFGEPNVSRVIVGGTIEELAGFSTIGVAQSIDVGNYNTEETGFVLLDVLSGQIPSSANLNDVPRAPGVSIIDVIATGVGEITAHEAGHYLGSWHTDQFNEIPNVMDQGGNLNFTILGLGPDGIFGTADDTNVQFVRDEFNPNEGFTGIEDTRSVTSYGATKATGLRRDAQ